MTAYYTKNEITIKLTFMHLFHFINIVFFSTTTTIYFIVLILLELCHMTISIKLLVVLLLTENVEWIELNTRRIRWVLIS